MIEYPVVDVNFLSYVGSIYHLWNWEAAILITSG